MLSSFQIPFESCPKTSDNRGYLRFFAENRLRDAKRRRHEALRSVSQDWLRK